MKNEGVLRVDFFEEVFDHLLLRAAAGRVHPVVAFLQFIPLVQEQRHIAPVVHDQLRALPFCIHDGRPGAVPVFLQSLAFPSEHRDPRSRDGSRGMVLGGKDVAAGPADRGAQSHQRLNQNRRLDGHVQRSRDPHSSQRPARGVLGADGHQAWHFVFRDGDFLAAELGQSDVGDFVVRAGDGLGAHDFGSAVCVRFEDPDSAG